MYEHLELYNDTIDSSTIAQANVENNNQQQISEMYLISAPEDKYSA